ncbi:MAG: hypothetical protein PHY48_11215 [Candidatus Cloacimonetes bacterium]|nr:hypothetical protein [Candidatus Cloacimonadota bacterium]
MKSKNLSSLRDNSSRGTVGEFISDKLSPNCKLYFVSDYFIIYAYLQLKNKLVPPIKVYWGLVLIALFINRMTLPKVKPI